MIALRWALGAAVIVLGAVAAALLLVGRPHSTPSAAAAADDTPAARWAAAKRRAPAFTLADRHGTRYSLASLHGRPVILTFLDPLCRDYCPIEAQHLNTALRSLPAAQRPAVVAVSVNTAGNASSTLELDNRKWQLGPEWRWGIGSGEQLARVWKAYGIEVIVTKRKIAGVSVRYIGHTEAAYVIDRNGFERALFLWPYSAEGVLATLRSFSS